MQVFAKKLKFQNVLVYTGFTATLPILLAIWFFSGGRQFAELGAVIAGFYILAVWVIVALIILIAMLVKSKETDRKDQLLYSFIFIASNIVLFYIVFYAIKILKS